jgi:hypothetical protein
MIKPSNIHLRAAGGHALCVTGQLSLKYDFGNSVVVPHMTQVVSDMSKTLLIGSDFILDRISMFRGRRLEVEYEGKKAAMPIEYTMPRATVAVNRRTEIAPMSVHFVECSLEFDAPIHEWREFQCNRTFLVHERDDDNDDCLGIEEAIATADGDNKITCLIANTSSEPLTLTRGLTVGQATPVHQTVDDGEAQFEEMHYDEAKHVYYLHEASTRDEILHGNPDGFNPIPPGYEAIDPALMGKPVNIEEADAQGLDSTQRLELFRILNHYKGVMSTGPADYGRTPLMSFEIKTEGHEPVAARYRPIPAAYEKEVKATIKTMLDTDVIEEADSPWNSTLVLVRKPNGKLRICVNLKGVNAVTTNGTSYPINQQEESFARLCNGKYFFKLDLSQAYYSIPMDNKDDRDKTAFSVFGKQYRFKVSPFGARYLPSRFNKLMTTILGGLEHYLFYYFDDVIGCFQTPDELFDGLATVLQRLITANLRVNFAKSNFCLTTLDKIKWLGTVIQGNKVYPDSDKIKAILEMPIPHTRNGLQRFLGAVNYHRRHLPHLADLQAPLNKLVSKNEPFRMTKERIDVFEKLKKALARAPALALPDTNRPFIITTDASDIGVGGVLTQPAERPDEPETVIAYCSRTLSANEQNGSSCEKEILAILYAVSYFHFYIANAHFTLRSDSKSLVYLRHFRNLNSKIFRASLVLDELSFDIQHMSATRANVMGIADMISRAYGDDADDPPRASYKTLRDPIFQKLTAPPGLPATPISKEEFDLLADNYLAAFLSENPTATAKNENRKINIIETAINPDDLATVLSCRFRADKINENASPAFEIRRVGQRQPTLTPEIFKRAQRDDDALAPKIAALEQQDRNAFNDEYFLVKEILCCKRVPPNGLARTVILVPTALQEEVLRYYHGAPQGAHIGRKRLYATLQ